MSGSFVAQAAPRNLAQLLLHERDDAAERGLVASSPRKQKRRHVRVLIRNGRDFTPESLP
jgi:hypothetical protein